MPLEAHACRGPPKLSSSCREEFWGHLPSSPNHFLSPAQQWEAASINGGFMIYGHIYLSGSPGEGA